MSAEQILTAAGDAAERGGERVERCRVPNCWRDASTVRIGGSDREAILCKRHRRHFLGVSS